MTGINNIKGAVFDADGTLFDSMWMWRQVESGYLKRFDVSPRPDLIEALRALTLIEVAEYFQAEYGVRKTIEEITYEKNAMMEDFYNREVTLKSGVLPVLETFRARGIKMCVATATDRHLIVPALQYTGILGFFDRIFTCSEERTSKKKPEIFIRAAAFLGTGISETLVLEDALHAVKSAKSAGFPVIGVYDLSAAIHQEEIKEACDLYFMSMDDMLEII